MTAGVVSICGAWGGNMHRATPHNKKGMFENREIVNTMVKPLLVEMGADPMGQKPLPDIRYVSSFMSHDVWKKRFLKVMESQGYNNGSVLMYKGAKMCLMWTLWHDAFPDAKWIIVRRRSEDIINSCLRTGFMKAYQDREGWLFWVREHVKLFKQMFEAGLDIREVFPQEMIDGNYIEIESVVRWAGLEWREKEVKDFISPDLWNKERK